MSINNNNNNLGIKLGHPVGWACPSGLSTCHFAWAFHSEAEEELLNMIPAMQRGDAQWSDLRAVGVGWWIRNINTLRKMVDKVPESCSVLLIRSSSSSSMFVLFVFDAELIYHLCVEKTHRSLILGFF